MIEGQGSADAGEALGSATASQKERRGSAGRTRLLIAAAAILAAGMVAAAIFAAYCANAGTNFRADVQSWAGTKLEAPEFAVEISQKPRGIRLKRCSARFGWRVALDLSDEKPESFPDKAMYEREMRFVKAYQEIEQRLQVHYRKQLESMGFDLSSGPSHPLSQDVLENVSVYVDQCGNRVFVVRVQVTDDPDDLWFMPEEVDRSKVRLAGLVDIDCTFLRLRR